jgi:conjugative transfer region lipoprotein (TIGR03751 family)
MLKFHKQTIQALILTTLISLAGCSSKGSVIPKSDVSIADVYKNRMNKTANRSMRLAVNEPLEHANVDVDVDAYTLLNMKQTNYKYLPNPTLYMYVNYRLSEVDRSPIPSFLTEFKLYERDEYALPNEININWGSK